VIALNFKSQSGTAISLPLTGSGFYRMGAGLPDVFVALEFERIQLVLANGHVSPPPDQTLLATPPIIGTCNLTYGGETLLPAKEVTIRYGCAEVVRIGKPREYRPPAAWTDFWLRHMPTEPATAVKVIAQIEQADYGFDDTGFQNPDQSGSARVCQSVWAGTLAAALDIDVDRARFAAEKFTDCQLRWRHALFYDDAGRVLRAHEQPWWRVGASGWDGQVKWTSDSPYKFETVQHLAPDRFLALAVGWGDLAALLYTDAYIESVLTRPEFRASQLADDQRSHGYCMRLAALWTLAGMGSAERDKALLRVVDGWRRANGVAFTGEPYPSIAPVHTGKWSHGYPSLVDWLPYAKANKLVLPASLAPPLPGETCDHLRGWLEAQALSRGLPKNAFTDGTAGLWQGAVVVWQTAVALGALCALRDVPEAAALVPDVSKMIQHSTACIVGPGAAPGIGPTGITLFPNPVHDAYMARHPERVSVGGGKNGTSTWIVNPLLAAVQSLGPTLASQARDLAALEWKLTDYPSPPDLQTTGLLPIKELGLKP